MKVFPNAKINIGLFITGKRADGFHSIASLFYPIGLSDTLEIEAFSGKPGEYLFTNSGLLVDCSDENNLVVKAYQLLSRKYALPALRIHLHKVIPFGAGLGGGSSDAAYMLKALNSYFDLKINAGELQIYAAELGSDCAFFINNKPVFAYGRGELFKEQSLSLENYSIGLVKPFCSISTKDAYFGIDTHPASYDLQQLNETNISQWKREVFNDFEKKVVIKYPDIARIKEQFYKNGAIYASMTGSGSGVYGIFDKGKVNLENLPEVEFSWQENEV